jgi:beta-glucosidase
LDRSIADAFAEYSGIAVRAFGDRVKTWFTINEPFCASHLGYTYGEHAPGMKDRSKGLLAAHHLLLAHGKAVQVVRAAWQDARVGIVLNLTPMHNDPDAPVNPDTLRHSDGESNRWFIDPIYGRGYPEDMLDDFVAMGVLDSTAPEFIKSGDMELIAQPTDLLGINYYTRFVTSSPPKSNGALFENTRKNFPQEQMTEMGWELYPRGLYEIIERVYREYHPKQIMITESGASYSDKPDETGQVHDQRRIAYLQTHIQAVWQAIQEGIPVSAYLVWSLMDNFEWAHGYSQRFGLVYIDFSNQQRFPKDSAYWFGQVIQRNGILVD